MLILNEMMLWWMRGIQWWYRLSLWKVLLLLVGSFNTKNGNKFSFLTFSFMSCVYFLFCLLPTLLQFQCRYRENRHVSMGAEKWLDIELWNSTPECFKILKSRGYRIVSTHLGTNAVLNNFALSSFSTIYNIEVMSLLLSTGFVEVFIMFETF